VSTPALGAATPVLAMPVLDAGHLSLWCRCCLWRSNPRAVSGTDHLEFAATWAAAEADWARHACDASPGEPSARRPDRGWTSDR